MTRDINVLRAWLLAVVFIAAVGANSFPIIYSFFPWRSHLIGRLLMLQGVAFAAAIDMTVLFAFWTPEDILVIFWVQGLVFTGIAWSTISLTWGMWRMNHPKKRSFQMLFSETVYEVLKKIVQIVLPGLASLYFGLAQIWGLPNAENVVGSIALLTAFLGLCLGISSRSYNSTDAKFDGTLVLEPNEDGSQLRLQSISQKALESKDHILLKVDRG